MLRKFVNINDTHSFSLFLSSLFLLFNYLKKKVIKCPYLKFSQVDCEKIEAACRCRITNTIDIDGIVIKSCPSSIIVVLAGKRILRAIIY